MRATGMLALALGLALALPAQAGLLVYGTRFVMTAGQESRTLTVENTGEGVLLVNSAVASADARLTGGAVAGPQSGSAPFSVVPPLFALAGGKSNKLRLVCTGCAALPADRESLFSLAIAAIPDGKAPVNTVQLAVRQRFKLFYRPKGLAGTGTPPYQQLIWQREGATVVVKNPTPYYVTLVNMRVNGQLRPTADMVPPLTTRRLAGCPTTGSCQVRWQDLDDLSRPLPLWQVSPGATARLGQAVVGASTPGPARP